jgi:heat-inducible transcriptional repressor
MELSDRKKLILRSIIDAYIESAEPVGSRTISKKNLLDLSPATIRNEMADLEEMGYLEQPHTSAGRVPSRMGYRFYVDSLMQQYRLSAQEMEAMKQSMMVKCNELDRILNFMVQSISQFTNYTTLAVTPAMNKSVIKKVELVPIDDNNFLLVILTSGGTTKNRLFKSERPLKSDVISMMRYFLNLTVVNKPASEISMESILSLETAMGEHKDLVMPMLRFVTQAINEMDNDNIHLSGVQKMLEYPEYQDMDKVKDFLSMVENKQIFNDIIESADLSDTPTVIIGDENEKLKSHDTSLVVCKYKTKDDDCGVIGIIGPTRMDYAKAVTSLEFFSKNLNRLLGSETTTEQKEEHHGQEEGSGQDSGAKL